MNSEHIYIKTHTPGSEKGRSGTCNEHLTMQIARQVYGLKTAENALIFFQDGTPAYLTKRFDVKEDGTKSKYPRHCLGNHPSDV
ncbi:hypothetical protein [Daejeonella sp.]|uniref:hypothetical protein n=1 Tax=Daejeonella sp. TaxID=2805397 RepID=UPI002BE1D967|nr:hypothetical protein [Daejeonella sp.]HQT21521.1 hypothetical protein [Daejeonella sp.]HQT56252.1 hypothetical protein [Daejeonella sp.]